MKIGSAFNERVWMAWLVKVRILVITFVLGIELAVSHHSLPPVARHIFLGAIGLWYAMGLFHGFLLRWRPGSDVPVRLQLFTDLLLATVVLHATGGIDSLFPTLFPLIIVTAAIVLPRYWAYLTAALAFILYGGLLELTYFGWLPSYGWSRPGLTALQATIFMNLFAYVAIAHLASHLVGKLRRVDVQLREKSGALQELRALHENIVRSMSGGLITTDLDGRIRVINPAGERLMGRSGTAILGTPIHQLFADELPIAGEARRELQYAAPDGLAKTFGMTACPLAGSGGEVVGRVYTFTDLTEIHRLRKEIMIRDRMSAVGRLASGIAHEIRNPLAAIAGSAQLLGECNGLGDDERSLLDIVRRESMRLNKIVSDFLAYSRLKQYRYASHDLLRLLEETLLLLENRPECAGGSVRLVRQYQVTEAVAEVDEDRMRQVFWNICDNALHAMPEGGTLTVAASASADGFIITFTDTGKGIPPQDLEKIFEPFHSTFTNGTGLGLAIVYQILQAHDAGIQVQSSPNRGTEFSLQLKRTADRAKEDLTVSIAGGSGRG